ncbi:hypothetical protein JTY60_02275 [symbiont of Argiope bruennichi]|uniref:ABC transporter permease n=1 Tax=symbiont of Argiope bruennichi TaxID=2810479 RepID=UPI003DA6A646
MKFPSNRLKSNFKFDSFGAKSNFAHFLWNLKFKFFTKINYFVFGLITFLAILFSFLAASSIKNAKPVQFGPNDLAKIIMLGVIIVFVVFITILFLVISTSSHTSEEKNSRAMEIILSSVGVKFHWYVKLLTNFIWFVSIFLWMFIVANIASAISGIIFLSHIENGSMIICWVLGFSNSCAWLVNNGHSITFSYFWHNANMAHGYDFFVTMIFATIMINGIIYSIITLALSSFIVNSGESLMIVLVMLLFPIIFSIILRLIFEDSKFLNYFLCYFPLTSIYSIPTILFEKASNSTPDYVVWTAILANIFYIYLFNFLFSKIFASGVLDYSSNKKIFRRIIALIKPNKKIQPKK